MNGESKALKGLLDRAEVPPYHVNARESDVVDVDGQRNVLREHPGVEVIEGLLVCEVCDEHADWTAGRDVSLIRAQIGEELCDVASATKFAQEPDENLMMRCRGIELCDIGLEHPAAAKM